ncbi:MAG: lysophospholipid acyltransferase family protein [Christensenellales bacterium]|jgi:1-acyl-sn-glycerol-3-phosphate acyltransferase
MYAIKPWLRSFALAVLPTINRVFLGHQVDGLDNLRDVRGPVISLCNHVHYLDCTMVACALRDRELFFPTLATNFDIPVANWLIARLGGVPIPTRMQGMVRFSHEVSELLQAGKSIHLFPEGWLTPYCEGLRPFKKGAFSFAYLNNVPLVPMVITYHEPEGWQRFFKSKPALHLHILPPVYPNLQAPQGREIERLRACCYSAMAEAYAAHSAPEAVVPVAASRG